MGLLISAAPGTPPHCAPRRLQETQRLLSEPGRAWGACWRMLQRSCHCRPRLAQLPAAAGGAGRPQPRRRPRASPLQRSLRARRDALPCRLPRTRAVPGISAAPSEDNLRYFNVIILGPEDSPFQGGWRAAMQACRRGCKLQAVRGCWQMAARGGACVGPPASAALPVPVLQGASISLSCSCPRTTLWRRPR